MRACVRQRCGTGETIGQRDMQGHPAGEILLVKKACIETHPKSSCHASSHAQKARLWKEEP